MTEHTKETSDLLPCPVCGGAEALYIEHTKGPPRRLALHLYCEKCGATTYRTHTPEAAALILAKEALAPFAVDAENFPPEWPDTANNLGDFALSTSTTIGDFRRAAAALDAISKLEVK